MILTFCDKQSVEKVEGVNKYEKGVNRPASLHFPFTLLPSPAHLPKSKCQHACKHKFQLNESMVWGPLNKAITLSLFYKGWFIRDEM